MSEIIAMIILLGAAIAIPLYLFAVVPLREAQRAREQAEKLWWD